MSWKLSKNAACPCGSGKKYKLCCLRKGIEYRQDAEGNLYRMAPVSSEAVALLEEQRKAFAERFGREPGPEDPVFFDLPPQEHLEAEVVKGMKKAGLHPALIYAFEKTGLIVSESNQHLIPEGDLSRWNAAIEEYERLHGGA